MTVGAERSAPAARGSSDQNLLPWTLSFLRPHRTKVVLLVILLASEIGLGVAQPWPFALVLDLLTGHPLPGWMMIVVPGLAAFATTHAFALLVTIVIAGVVLQVVN